jgi:hypothetical protein
MEKYTTTALINSIQDVKEKEAEEKKVILSNDSFAICEFIENLTISLERLRISVRNFR